MYGLCRTLQPPTGIEHCISGNFTSAIDINLIVSRANILEIYTLCRSGNETNLMLTQQYSLNGNIESLSLLRITGHILDTLLVTFAEAKIVHYLFDSASNSLISLFSNQYDDKDRKRHKVSSTPQSQHPTMKVDPLYRCVAMVFGGTRLVVLPINQPNNQGLDSTSNLNLYLNTPTFGTPWTIDLQTLNILYPILDFDFLCGYNDPTILILFHSKLTWEGRFAVCKENTSLLALSLNLADSEHISVPFLDSLPNDLFKIQVLPSPLSGCLLIGCNMIMRVTHTVDAVISLNEFGDKYSSSYHFNRSDFTTSLQSPHITLLTMSNTNSFHYIITTQSGNIYILSITELGVHDCTLILQSIGESAMSTCVCTLLSEYAFIGSRLGDSCLINLQMKLGFEKVIENPKKTGKKSSKNKKIKDESNIVSSKREISFTFQIKDTLPCFGPVSDMIMTESVVSLSSFTQTNTGSMFIGQSLPGQPESGQINPKPMDILTSIGHSKEGAICILHGGIRPNILSSFPLDLPSSGCWSVYGQILTDSSNIAINTRSDGSKKMKLKNKNSKQINIIDSKTQTQYMFISNLISKKTIVYSMFEERLYEVNGSEFILDYVSIAVENISDNTRIVQVYTEGIRLLNDTKSLQDIPCENRIVSCSIVDPYIVVLTTKGYIKLFVFSKHDNLLHSYTPNIPDYDRAGSVTAVCLFKVTETDTLCCLSRASSRLEIYRIEESTNSNTEEFFKLNRVFWSPNFALGFKVAENGQKTTNQKSDNSKSSITTENPHADIYITEISLFQLEHNRIFLAAYISTDDLLLYELYYHDTIDIVDQITVKKNKKEKNDSIMNHEEETTYHYDYNNLTEKSLSDVDDNSIVDQLYNIRFSKHTHTAFTREIKNSSNLSDEDGKNITVEEFLSSTIKKRLYPFDDINGQTGIFIRGNAVSYWLISQRSFPRIFSFSVNNTVSCFSHTKNSFSYLDTAGNLQICQLSSKMSYDSSFPILKIPVGMTVEYITIHSPTNVIAVSTSRPIQINSFEEVSDRSIPIYELKYELQVFSPLTMKIDNVYDKFGEHESIMVLKSVTLRQIGNPQRKQVFLAVATATLENEEIGCRGQVYLFDIYQANIVSVEGTQLAEQETIQIFKIQHIYTHKEKGPVSALSTIDGMLVVAVGPKIILYRWDGTDMIATAFYDSELMTSTIDSFRNYLICGDVFKSVYLLIWEPITKQLCLIGKDTKMIGIYSTKFLIFNDDVNFLTSDSSKNIMLLSCEQPDSSTTKSLTRTADYHLGSILSTVTVLRTCYPVESNNLNQLQQSSIIQSFAFGGTHDGSFVSVLPLLPRVYSRLNLLFGLLLKIPKISISISDINADFRNFKPSDYSLIQSKKNILDGGILFEYMKLDIPTQRRLARSAGASPNLFINYLIHASKATSFL